MSSGRATILARPTAMLLVLALPSAAGLASPGEPPPLPACTDEQVKEWQALVAEPLGIRGEEKWRALDTHATDQTCPTGPVETFLPDDHVLFWGQQNGRANDGVHSWVYASRCKLTVCGEPHSLQNNLRTPWLSGEYDLNSNVLVAGKDKVTNALLDRQSCEGGGGLAQQTTDICFEPPVGNRRWLLHLEITPPLDLRCPLRRLWCGGGTPSSWHKWRDELYEKTFCVHGPLVADTGHGAKAEVHPTQLFWWKVEPTPPLPTRIPGGVFHIFAVQEASSRFNREQNFVIDDPFPETSRVWRPWGQGPLTATFTIPFRRGPAEGPAPMITFAPSPYVPARRAAPKPGEAPPTLDIAGVKVNWFIPDRPSVLEVKPGFACRCEGTQNCRGDGAVIGTLLATVSVGRDREWEEGFLAMEVFDSRSQSGPTSPLPPSCHAPSECTVLPDASTDPPTIGASVRWRSSGSWMPVSFTEDLGARMFEAAGWSGSEGPKFSKPPAVQRLRRARLRMRTELLGAPPENEESEGKARFSIDWNVCARPVGPAPQDCPQRIAKRDGMAKPDKSEVEVDIVSDALQVIEVEAKVRSETTSAAPPEGHPVVQRFWSHAFVDPENPSTADTVKRGRRIKQTLKSQWALDWRQWAATECRSRRPRETPQGQRPYYEVLTDGAPVDPLPLAAVESRLRRALLDGRLTVTELASVVVGINECGQLSREKPTRASR